MKLNWKVSARNDHKQYHLKLLKKKYADENKERKLKEAQQQSFKKLLELEREKLENHTENDNLTEEQKDFQR
jgi:hypothetical protein